MLNLGTWVLKSQFLENSFIKSLVYICILSSEYMINSLIPLCSTGTNDQLMKLLRELVNGDDLWLWNLTYKFNDDSWKNVLEMFPDLPVLISCGGRHWLCWLPVFEGALNNPEIINILHFCPSVELLPFTTTSSSWIYLIDLVIRI